MKCTSFVQTTAKKQKIFNLSRQKAENPHILQGGTCKSLSFLLWLQQLINYQNCETLHAHTESLHFTCFLMNFNSTEPPPTLPRTSNPGQFLSPVWGTSDVGGCGFGRTGGQDVSLIITQSDLLPAPDSLPPAPDTSSSAGRDGGTGGGTYGLRLTASSSSRGRFRILPHADTMPWSPNWLILRPPFSSARLPLLPLRSPLLP